MQTLTFSNGVKIDTAQIISVESSQQTIELPGLIGELTHLLEGRPSGLLIRMRDGSTVEINAGNARLRIESSEPSQAMAQ